jgi:UDPglucose 6-dehydrogenase
MHIAMIGSGYVGLVSGACLADFGHNVICADKDADKISALQQGERPVFEPGLADLIGGNSRVGCLSFTMELRKPVAASQAVFISVGTPYATRGWTRRSFVRLHSCARDRPCS